MTMLNKLIVTAKKEQLGDDYEEDLDLELEDISKLRFNLKNLSSIFKQISR